MPDNHKNDPIEKLFREKSEQYDISYREEDWLELEDRLDNLDKQMATRRKIQLIAAAVALVFSLLAYITYQNYMKINELNEKLNNQQITTNEPDITSPDVSDTDRQPKATDNDIASADGNPTPTSGSSTEKAELGTTMANDKKGDRGSPNFLTSDNFARVTPDYILPCPECGLSNPDNWQPPSGLNPIAPSTKSMVATLSTKPVDSHKNQIPGQSLSQLAIGISVAPDLSTVGSLSNFQNPGHKFGISVEYSFNRNLAISTGAMRSTVRYVAKGEDYNPSTYWKKGVRPDEAIAECILIDIPVSLKYNFMHFNHSRLFATANISTYIMLSEDYQFNYASNDSDLIQNWSGRTGTSHWMSNAGISIGYEVDVYRNVSFRAEPFIKVPLREVGWGNVKLFSMGSFFSINYNLQSFK